MRLAKDSRITNGTHINQSWGEAGVIAPFLYNAQGCYNSQRGISATRRNERADAAVLLLALNNGEEPDYAMTLHFHLRTIGPRVILIRPETA